MYVCVDYMNLLKYMYLYLLYVDETAVFIWI